MPQQTVASFVITGTPSSVGAGQPFSFTVTAEDSQGHTVTGYTGTVTFKSSDSAAALPPNFTFTAANQGTATCSDSRGTVNGWHCAGANATGLILPALLA
jgi:hypothetical protein